MRVDVILLYRLLRLFLDIDDKHVKIGNMHGVSLIVKTARADNFDFDTFSINLSYAS